jgi:nitrate reductase assembly molybdenum cofactor insertion protein NarJ/NAD-dependent dihydropyrimidine dehydrogenase PreA subunit
MFRSDRADLYALLAETLAEPPDWMSLPGRAWPLFETLTGLASESDAARRHLDLLAGIPCEGPDQRRERYAALFASGRPRFWLYESAAKTGKILGPQTFEMARLYRAAGLEAAGAELPDHISLELAFLSYLVGRDAIPAYQEILQQFLEKHGDWMISLGCALKQSGDPVYAPIGALLADWLTERMTLPAQPATVTHDAVCNMLLPVILRADDCTLCGFCAQVCPTRALKVMQNAEGDFLSLNIAECVHCAKCERICEFHALKMSLPAPSAEETLILRQSPHARCQTCGKPIASQAEMDYIVSQIGDATWQHLCLDCRVGLYNARGHGALAP